MRQSNLLLPTLREAPGEAEAVSHALLQRAGYIRQLASGIYTYLPLGRKMLRKAEEIIREEMERAGAQELFMPALQPAELMQQSGRYSVYGPELFRLRDRHDREFVLGPTHEEVITALAGGEIDSYRKLPLTLYQIQTKFRDERRPRFGLLRGREFLMKDAYSFDIDEPGLNASYEAMLTAYHRIFLRLGLRYRAVEADPGAIGGEGGTHEFMALADSGEDIIACCTSCDYAANLEKAEGKSLVPSATTGSDSKLHTLDALTDSGAAILSQEGGEPLVSPNSSPGSAPRKLHTPGIRTIAELTDFLGISAASILKTVLFTAGGRAVAVVVRGDHEINELKVLQRLIREGLAGEEDMLELASPELILQVTGAPPGFAGPIGIAGTLLVDRDAAAVQAAVTGAGEEHYHLEHVVPGRDFPVAATGDFRNAAEGDRCPRCSDGRLVMSKGIELGHVFKLGTKYSVKLGASCLDADGKEKPMLMGCYGIGVSRLLAAAAEQHHDESGLVWPAALAPYHVHLIPVLYKDDSQRQLAEQLYSSLSALGAEVLLDDRDERPGVKFKDAELIGIPIRIVVGRDAAEGRVELTERSGCVKETLSAEEAAVRVGQLLERLRLQAE